MKYLHGMARQAQSITALNRLLELTVLLGADLTRGLGRHGLTEARARLVWVLGQRGPSTQRALAAALQVSARNVTGLVDGLVATGFVTRRPHPDDRRAVLVTLTERGSSTVAALQAEQRELARTLFGRVPGTRVDDLVAGLDLVLARLRGLAAAEMITEP